MSGEIKVALIGLDTSHTIEFARRMQAPECPADQKVPGLKAVSCLRFATPFQSEAGLNERQKQLEDWGVKVTLDFDETVADCDALMIEINDPSYHLDYFTRCANLKKPIFLDKPMADTLVNARKISNLIDSKNLKVFSTSSLRFVPQLKEACDKMPSPIFVTFYGPLGKAPAGSSIVWYGVHTFEMLERAMGRGAAGVFVKKDSAGITAVVKYPDNRRGIIELTYDAFVYGGCLRNKETAAPFSVDMTRAYSDLLFETAKFFKTGKTPVAIEDTLEIMGLLDAADRSNESGRDEPVNKTDRS